jgi:outer membrane protein TolC
MTSLSRLRRRLPWRRRLRQAFEQRPDLKAAAAQVRAAELARSGARSERLPSLSVNADYGVIGTNPSQSHGTFSVTGTLRFPIWEGGRTGAISSKPTPP